MHHSKTRDAILRAAVELAASQGISGTSMDAIAETAGVAKGSLYYNFKSKDAIFEELVHTGLNDLAEYLERSRAQLRGGAALAAMIHEMFGILQRRPQMAKILAAELFRTDRSWADSLMLLQRGIVEQFHECLVEAWGDEASADAPLTSISASGVFGMVLFAGIGWLRFFPERTLDEATQATLLTLAVPGIDQWHPDAVSGAQRGQSHGCSHDVAPRP
ncbi:TetR/AcrR family transcriptional regulator [Pseudoclavibacter sp. CFCC 11306]|uniref:TetR/AcrR family transcriptional regulator n=1 Tax=Pseudoclavibacter sp. CFCC 11306 TaxID=1564493 RepID=UPI0013010621|nr:TetR/AcrR family transcriptional regulator [Pseudoclavibacter sp. CFCC 11306]KAB1657072.1 TetR/AcrR family transcriptional regulator [Pseudoclavibacter sp. CFCC 11306]